MHLTWNFMKMIMYFLTCVIIGLIFMFLVNRSSLSDTTLGIELPFGWHGPYHQVLDREPKTHHAGLPFTSLKIIDNQAANYWNDLAIGLNAAFYVVLVTGLAFAGKKAFKAKTESNSEF